MSTPAFDERPLAKCLNDGAICEVYVLILAHRYGSKPGGGRWARAINHPTRPPFAAHTDAVTAPFAFRILIEGGSGC
jgi:hypothetical protein